MIITAFNPDTDELEKSYLSNAVSAGAISLTIKNNNRFTTNNRIQIGETGREKTEIVTLTAASGGTTLTTSATVFPHSADDPVYLLRFDQVRFYRSTTGPGGSYSLLSTQDLDVDNETLTTTYDDTTGIATYYYEISFYNSLSTLESSLSDPVLGSGYPRGSVGQMLEEFFTEIDDPEQQEISHDEVLAWFNEVNDDLMTRSEKPFAHWHTRTVVSRTAGATTLSFPTDMYKFDRLDYAFTDTSSETTTYPVRVKSLPEFRENYGDSSGGDANDELQFIALDDTVDKFRLWPRSKTTASTVFYIYYWKTPTELNSEGDLFETPNPRIYKMYALSRFYRKKAIRDFSVAGTAQLFLADYEKEVMKLNRTRHKDTGSPRSFKPQPQDYKGNRRF